MSDTPIEIEIRMAQMVASKTPMERLAMVGSLFESGRTIMKAGILARNPELNEAEMRARVFVGLYSEDFTKPQIEKILKHLESVFE